MVTRTHELSDADVDAIFHALADRTRRDIVARVIEREQSVSALAERYAMSFAAVQKHVAVLQKAALVRKERDGRKQIVHAEVERLRRAQQLLDRYEQLWRHRVDRIASILEEEGP
jgi:DNA-binding transcriptional ArsR family regulator